MGAADEAATDEALEDLIQRYAGYLTDYQNRAYANRYTQLVKQVMAADARMSDEPGPLSIAVARSYFRLLSYKDEYEVARLHTDPRYRDSLNARFGAKVRPHYHLAVPLLPGRDSRTGGAQKRTLGPWFTVMLQLLSRLRVVRGTLFDILGWQRERRIERRLIDEFERDISRLLSLVTSENYDEAVKLAALPQQIAGFGPVKMRSIKATAEQQQDMRTSLFGTSQPDGPQSRMTAEGLIFGNQ